MHAHSTRRWLAGLGVAGALVAASAIPAVAAPPPLPDRQAQEFALYGNNVTVAPGGPEKYVGLYGFAGEPLGTYTVTVDRGGVADFAVVRSAEGSVPCTEQGPVLTCKVDGDGEPEFGLIELAVQATDTAELGRKGELTFTVAAPGTGTETFRSTVTVGEGVDLAAGDDLSLRGAPGATVAARITLTNAGETTADGAVLLVAGSYAFTPAKRYENCEYAVDAFVQNIFACTFDGKVAPGETVAVDPSFGFAVPSDAWAPDQQPGVSIWLTKADWQEARDEVGLFGEVRAKGTGGTLRLTASRTAQSIPQTDTDFDNNAAGLLFEITGNQKADVVATGARVKGQVGTVVQTTVGYTNRGPAAVNTGGGEGLLALALVTVPVGTTAVKVPGDCFAADGSGEDGGDAGAAAYVCFLLDVIGKGRTAAFEFGLRIDKAGPLTGELVVITGNQTGERPDLDPANNTAAILVNPASGGGDNGPGEGGTAAPGGGQGGGLPVTGAPAGLIAGIGGLLLVAGAVGYLVARRRRTRFVA
ncbi:cell wall anchor protein [Micromonospora sp. NPDC050686]|uniref:cell wall anchor protein n=1 Tax=Micromonospora sp. NPDC050686 TaxID=3154631 RepID=UPI0033F75E92